MKHNLPVRKSALAVAAALAFVLTSLTGVFAIGDKEALNVGALNGPTAMGLVDLMHKAETGEVNYTFQIFGSPDEVVAELSTQSLDATAIPCNLASVLYNKTEGKIRLAAINTLGVLYVVETGDSVQSVADLKGKTIFATGKGATPEVVLRTVLTKNGIDPDKDVTIEFKSEATEVAALMKNAGDAAIAMLPQPFVTAAAMQNDKIRVALDMTKEWNAVSDGKDLITGCVAIRADVVKKKAEKVAAFMADYATSVQFVQENAGEAAKLIEEYSIVPKAAIAEKALPACNIVFIDGEKMKTLAESYFELLFEFDPKTVGGKLPAEDFYYLPAAK